jgi:hypothetical protein
MVVIQATREYVSKKPSHSFLCKSLSHKPSIVFSIVPLDLNFFLKIYLHPIGFHQLGQ